MNKDEALKMALEALENGKKVREGEGGTKFQPVLEDAAITAIEEALAQPEQVTHKYSLELPSGTDGEIRFAKVWWHDCKAEGNEILHRLCISVEEPVQDQTLKMDLATAYAVYDDARLARVKALGDYDKARLALSDAETAEQRARTALGVAMSGDTNYSEVNYDAH